MAQLGRNDPCRCGSGKKYKRCCGPVDEAASYAANRALQEAEAERVRAEKQQAQQFWSEYVAQAREDEAYTDESNATVELIHAGRLDEAEVRARALMARWPDAPDGLERLGHVYEARGDMKTAARHYREAIALVHGQGLPDDDHLIWLRELADRLDPPASA